MTSHPSASSKTPYVPSSNTPQGHFHPLPHHATPTKLSLFSSFLLSNPPQGLGMLVPLPPTPFLQLSAKSYSARVMTTPSRKASELHPHSSEFPGTQASSTPRSVQDTCLGAGGQ